MCDRRCKRLKRGDGMLWYSPAWQDADVRCWGDWGLSAGVDAELRNDNSGRENAVRRSMGGMAGCALGESQASMAPL